MVGARRKAKSENPRNPIAMSAHAFALTLPPEERAAPLIAADMA